MYCAYLHGVEIEHDCDSAGSLSTDVALEAALEIQQILSKPASHTTVSMPSLPPKTRTPVSAASASMPVIGSPKPTSTIVSLVAQRPPSVNASPAVVNALRRTSMNSPVPVKLGVPIKISGYEIQERASSPSDIDDENEEDESEDYSSDSNESYVDDSPAQLRRNRNRNDDDDDDDDESTSDSDLDKFYAVAFTSSPLIVRRSFSKRVLPKLGQSLSNLHSPKMMEAARLTAAGAPASKPVPIPIKETVVEEEDEDEAAVTPPARIPNPIPRNSPFWDRTHGMLLPFCLPFFYPYDALFSVNGAELSLLSIVTHAPFGEDEDRALRRLRVLGMPLPPPPATTFAPNTLSSSSSFISLNLSQNINATITNNPIDAKSSPKLSNSSRNINIPTEASKVSAGYPKDLSD